MKVPSHMHSIPHMLITWFYLVLNCQPPAPHGDLPIYVIYGVHGIPISRGESPLSCQRIRLLFSFLLLIKQLG
ncbi:hypothetical protein BDV24DRAFT_137334 [Aspergillus arachidicola]|uniref:Secreted protein n=1 Tax=Aspergillus arachidicola TaxID=656916 RepID=A0A5N6Y2N7_9EURO|nr:hypothetical protein BDV24DRAFT_137334 [Aspergillus arachidicola]